MKVFKKLHSEGTNIEIKILDRGALSYAAGNDNVELTQYVINNIALEEGTNTELGDALKENQFETARILVDRFLPERRSYSFEVAAEKGCLDILTTLLNINRSGIEKLTLNQRKERANIETSLLDNAIRDKQELVVKLLILNYEVPIIKDYVCYLTDPHFLKSKPGIEIVKFVIDIDSLDVNTIQDLTYTRNIIILYYIILYYYHVMS